jgi:hypothetical protein
MNTHFDAVEAGTICHPECAVAEITRLRAELATLHERLEDNRTYTGDGQRIEHEPGTIPDGIFCRDETIKLQDECIAGMEAELADARKDAERLTWLEAHYGLHEGIYILYVVDGYELTRTYDDTHYGQCYRGESLRAAIDAALADGKA